MIRIASLVPYRIMPAKMGGQKGIYLFLKYLSRHFDITCYTTRNNEAGSEVPFTVKKLLGTSKLRYINPAYYFRLKKMFQKDRITHLILEQPYYGWLALLLKKSLGIKLVLHSHNIEGLRFKSTGKWWWKTMHWYEGMVHRNADYNFFVTPEDLDYAVTHFRLQKERCTTITYGTERNSAPTKEERSIAKKTIQSMHSIPETHQILLFNGTLDYFPNTKGLDYILEQINPILQCEKYLSYHILICGSSLPARYNNLETYRRHNVTYAGFVDDIDLYFKGADIFINPVTEGGGIKTKLVESLAMGCSAISFENGAIGIPRDITGSELVVVPDHDIENFAKSVVSCIHQRKKNLAPSFFEHFYWGNIAAKAAECIQKA
jgi:hypothetical protein